MGSLTFTATAPPVLVNMTASTFATKDATAAREAADAADVVATKAARMAREPFPLGSAHAERDEYAALARGAAGRAASHAMDAAREAAECRAVEATDSRTAWHHEAQVAALRGCARHEFRMAEHYAAKVTTITEGA